MITIQLCDDLPGESIYAALYNRKPPPPNKSTQSVSNTYINSVRAVCAYDYSD